MAKSRKIRAVVVERALRLYRVPVFSELLGQDHPEIEWELIAGSSKPFGPQVPILTSADQDPRLSPFADRIHFVDNLLLGDILWQKKLIGQLRRGGYDVIVFEATLKFASSQVARLIALATGKRVLLWGHAMYGREGAVERAMKLLHFRLSHGVLLYGTHAYRLLSEAGMDPSKLYLLYNSLDTNEIRRVRATIGEEDIERCRKELFTHPERPMLLCVTRLTVRKQLDRLVHLGRELKQRNVPSNIVIVGDGPEHEKLVALIDELDVADVVQLRAGVYDEESVGLLFSSADLVVMPGPLGLTGIHALSYGTPVITHDNMNDQVPEAEVVQPGVTGAFYRYGDFDHLVATVTQWLAEAPDRTLNRERCIEHVERHYTVQHGVATLNRSALGLPAEPLS